MNSFRPGKPSPDSKLISPSQISTELSCARKWAYYKIAGIVAPSTSNQKLGTDAHAMIEAELLGAIPDRQTKVGRILEPGRSSYPEASQIIGVEQEILTPFEDPGFTLQTKIDLIYREGSKIVVRDHKTTLDFRWAKTPDLLLEDPQAAAYAYAVFLKFGVDVIGEWSYYCTQRPGHKLVRFEFADPREAFIRVCGDSIERILAMWKHVEKEDINELPPSPESCGIFGGCSHIYRCNLTKQERLKGALRMTDKNSFLAQLEARKAARLAADSGGSEVKAQVKASSANSDTSELAALEAKLAALKASLSKPEPTKNDAAQREAEEAAKLEAEAKREAEAKAAKLAALRAELEAAELEKAQVKANVQAPVAAPAPAPAVQVVSDPPVKRGPGRPRKHPLPETTAETTAKIGGDSPLMFLVGCMPVSGLEFSSIQSLVDQANEKIKEETGAPHWALIEFGKGKGLFIAKMKELFESEPGGSVYYVDSFSTDGGAAIDAIPNGSIVIRAVR